MYSTTLLSTLLAGNHKPEAQALPEYWIESQKVFTMKNQADNNNEVSTSQMNSTEGQVTKTVLEAMLECLTVEQQTRMTSFLLRRAKLQAQDRANGDAQTMSGLLQA